MKFKKSILITLVALTIVCLGTVSATDDVITADSTDKLETGNIEEESIATDMVSDESGPTEYDSEILKQTNENSLAEEGEFIDVNDAYVYLNQFRNETGVWQWNSDDSTKTVFNTNESNQLKPLARDLNLEQTAKIRAKELVEKFDHERPDGTMCYTAFPEGIGTMGENIAYGTSLTAKEVTELWKEINDLYEGQGHRRNMLGSEFNCVGIAGYKLNGVIYWVQDFGYSNNINEGEIIYTNTANGEENTVKDSKININIISKKATKITASKLKIFKAKTKIKKITVTLKAGKNAVKKVNTYLKIKGKTFKAVTNKKGKATFKIKLNKKGTFKSKITFKGDNNYKATSKTIKIKIK